MHADIPLFQILLARLSFPHCVFLALLSKIICRICGFISRLCILFYWSMSVFELLHIVLITVALYYILKSRSVRLPSMSYFSGWKANGAELNHLRPSLEQNYFSDEPELYQLSDLDIWEINACCDMPKTLCCSFYMAKNHQCYYSINLKFSNEIQRLKKLRIWSIKFK